LNKSERGNHTFIEIFEKNFKKKNRARRAEDWVFRLQQGCQFITEEEQRIQEKKKRKANAEKARSARSRRHPYSLFGEREPGRQRGEKVARQPLLFLKDHKGRTKRVRRKTRGEKTYTGFGGERLKT